MGIPFDAAIDMWSIGIVLCEAWMGKHMFQAESPGMLLREMIQILGNVPTDPFAKGKFYYAHYSDGTLIKDDTVASQFDFTIPREYAQ